MGWTQKQRKSQLEQPVEYELLITNNSNQTQIFNKCIIVYQKVDGPAIRVMVFSISPASQDHLS